MSAAEGRGPLERVLARLAAVRQSGSGWMARCPAHDDSRASLSVRGTGDGRVLLNCFAGCQTERVLDRIGLRFSDLRPLSSEPREQRTGITLSELAQAKGIAEQFLARLGLVTSTNPYDGLPQVEIPYHAPDGSLLAVKRRTDQSAGRGSYWPRGVPLAAYGLELLPQAREAGYCVLVEGESDLWTLVWHNIPALGIPGARAASTLAPEYLEGIRRLYISQEAGSGGEAFRKGVLERLREIGYRGSRRVLTWPEHAKDPNAFYLSDPTHFVERVRAMMMEADRAARARRFVRYPVPLLGPELLAEEIACMAALLDIGRERDDGASEVDTTPAALAQRGGFVGPDGPDTARCGLVLAGLVERGLVEIVRGAERTVFLLRPETWRSP